MLGSPKELEVGTAHAFKLIKLGLKTFMLKSLVLDHIYYYKYVFSLRRPCHAVG